MGKPRRKGMKKGYLKKFSSQMINGGRYSPKTTSKAEAARPERSMGFGRPDMNRPPPPLPVTIGKSIWEVSLNKSKRLRIKPEEVKFAPRLSNGVPLPIGAYHLCFVGNMWFWFHKEEGDMKRSITYHSVKRAECVFFAGTIEWANTT